MWFLILNFPNNPSILKHDDGTVVYFESISGVEQYIRSQKLKAGSYLVVDRDETMTNIDTIKFMEA